MMELDNRKGLLAANLLLFICSSICICLFGLMIANNNFSLMSFCPIVFAGLLLICPNIRQGLSRFDFLTVYIVGMCFIRYVIYIYLFCSLNAHNFYSLPKSELATVVFYIDEILTIVFLNRFIRLEDSISSVIEKNTDNRFWLIIILGIVSLIVLRLYPNVASNYQFIFNANVAAARGKEFTSIIESLGYVTIDVTRLLLPLVIINACYHRYNYTGNRLYIFLSLVACMFPMLIIKNMNRGSSFFTSLVYLWIMIKLFGWKKSKRYAVLSFIGLIALLVSISLVKHATGIASSGFTVKYLYDVIESYTIGVESFRIGLVTNETYSNLNRVYVLFNDVFSSLPVLNRLTDYSMRYSSLYNTVCYLGVYNKNDALAPFVTNMLYVFNIFGFALPVFMLKLSVKSFYKGMRSSSINKMFVFVYASEVFFSGKNGSLSATISSLVWIVMPLMISVSLLDKVGFRLWKKR